MNFGAYQFEFINPIAFLAIVTLPIIYFVSHLLQPKAKKLEFSAVFILEKLAKRPPRPAKPPIWQIIIRILAILSIIIAITDPRIAKSTKKIVQSQNIEIFIDDNFTQNQDWKERTKPIIDYLNGLDATNISIYFLGSTEKNIINTNNFDAIHTISNLKFSNIDKSHNVATIQKILEPKKSEIIYFPDGIETENSNEFFEFLNARAQGSVKILSPPAIKIIKNISFIGNKAQVDIFSNTNAKSIVNAYDNDGKLLAKSQFNGTSQIVDLPENKFAADFKIEGQNHAGAVYLTQFYGKKPIIGILNDETATSDYFSDYRFLKAAAAISAKPVTFKIDELGHKSIDIALIGDRTGFTQSESAALNKFAQNGGTIIRFLGPKSLAKPDDEILTGTIKEQEHNLVGQINPTKINISAFDANSIFAGIEIPKDTIIEKSILFEKPNPQTQILARLTDGAPLISMNEVSKGRIYVIHTTASPLWSGMGVGPLQFQLLNRIFDHFGSRIDTNSTDVTASVFINNIIDYDGNILNQSPPKQIEALPEKADNFHPPGIYWQNHNIPINVAHNRIFSAAKYPNIFENFSIETNVKKFRGAFFAIGLLLLLLDNLLGAFNGMFKGIKLQRSAKILALVLIALTLPKPIFAQAVKDNLKLAYLITGDANTDNKANNALKGLSIALERRTNIEPSGVIGLSPDSAQIFKQPIIYWLLPPNSKPLSQKQAENLNKFMRSGGVLFIDTQGKSQTQSAANANLNRAISGLNFPQIEKVPNDHVLRKSFYLLQGFPGLYQNGEIWVESAKSANSNSFDGVSPIIIGDGDWASIWSLYAKMPFSPFDYQKEIPMRVGINIYMYALTGQYKNDQLHIDAILKRLNPKVKK